jgi:group I intron endonuclease
MDFPVIYILTNKNNGKRYVGLARKSFKSRLCSHLKNDSYIGKALRKNGLEGFEIQQIAYSADQLNYWEKYFISKLNTKHPNGYNLTDGGDGLCNPSQVIRDRLSKAMKDAGRPYANCTFAGHIHSEESKQQISETLKVSMSLPEVKERMSLSHKGIPLKEEHRNKIGDSNRGRKRIDAEKFSERMKIVSSKEGYVNPMQGRKRPELSERNRLGKGRKDSEETLIRKSLASKGKPKAPEHARKIKESRARNKLLREQAQAAIG